MQSRVQIVPLETFDLMPNRIVGVLDAFFETGTEGVVWSIVDNDKTGYEALSRIKDGDYLFVEDMAGNIEWEGKILLDWKSRMRPYPTNPESGQQEVLGYWVHGLQVGVEPERWAKWFFESRPAVVIPGERYGTPTNR
jgi:hypothetical protein